MFWPSKMSHSFIQNGCWITVQDSHHQGRKNLSKKMKGRKTNFSRRLKQFDGLTWMILPPPPHTHTHFTAEPRYCVFLALSVILLNDLYFVLYALQISLLRWVAVFAAVTSWRRLWCSGTAYSWNDDLVSLHPQAIHIHVSHKCLKCHANSIQFCFCSILYKYVMLTVSMSGRVQS